MGTRITTQHWAGAERGTVAWLRHRVTRRRRALAVAAIVEVLHESIRYIRAMAQRREDMCGDVFPGHDYHQQISELSALCATLLPGLAPGGHPAQTLKSTWDSRSVPGRQWIRRCLAVHDLVLDDIIDTR